MNSEIFREYDIRGHAKKDLDKKTVYAIARAFGSMVKKKKGERVCLGKDNRKSSERIGKAFTQGLLDSGLNVIDVGIVTIPALYYSIIALQAQGGVMVTGSHLAKEFNGFKLSASGNASTLFGEQIQKLKEIAEKKQFTKGKGKLEKRKILKEYLATLVERIELKKPLSVAIDCGNGASSLIAEKLLKAIGCRVKPLYCELNSEFPNHHPDPVKPKNLSDLIKTVKSKGFDLGIAFDGDADRLGVVDESGQILWGDVLLSLFARDILKRKKGAKIVFEVKCSKMVEDVVKKAGGKPIMYKTGHSLIKKKMREENASLAGEMSGHLFFADNYYGFDDALFAAARLCELVSKKTALSKMVSSLPKYYSTPEIRVSTTESEKWRIVKKAKEHFSQEFNAVTVDGVRFNALNGWALIRASNTSPKLVLRMEAKSKQGLEKIKKIVRSGLNSISPELKLEF